MRRLFLVLLLGGILLHLRATARRREAGDHLCERLSGQSVTVEGTPVAIDSTRWRLLAPHWEPAVGSPDWAVFFSGTGVDPERRVRISGPMKCRVPLKNPGAMEDGRMGLRERGVNVRGAIRLLEKAPLWQRAREVFRARLDRVLSTIPGMHGLALAVWLGETALLPPFWMPLYREGGLLHILALSGQHVVALLFLVHFLGRMVWPFAAAYRVRRALGAAQRWLPIAAAGVLCVLNPFNQPIHRAAFLLVAGQVIASRGVRVSGLQLVASSVALALLCVPLRLGSDSFALSAVATGCLFAATAGRGWKAFCFLNVAMPFLLLPATLFLFAKISPMAWVNGVLLAWIWGVFWIPLGFAVGILAAVLPVAGLASGLAGFEGLWNGFVMLHVYAGPSMAAGYRTTLRPTVFETVLLQVLVGILVGGAARQLGFFRTVK